MNPTVARSLYAIPLILIVCLPAPAQRFRPIGRQLFRNANTVNASGQIVAVSLGFVHVKANAKDWMLKVEAKPENITLVGVADKSWLRRGMFVRFAASFDKKGIVQTPIDELFVFTPRPGYVIGIVPDKPFSGDLTFGEEKPKPQARAQTYLVAGQLSKVKQDTMIVVTGRQKVMATLAKEASINVDLLGDYSFARPGDKVEFRGKYLFPGQAVVQELKITGDKPFSGARAAPSGKGKRRQPVYSKNTTLPRKDP